MFKRYILIIIIASGYIISSKSIYAGTSTTTLSLPQEIPAEAVQMQSNDKKYVNQQAIQPSCSKRLLQFSTMIALIYLFDRSMVAAHEGGHALAALIAGKKLTQFYISSRLGGGGYIQRSFLPEEIYKNLFIHLSGPIGGLCGSFAVTQLWEKIKRYIFNENEGQNWDLIIKYRAGYSALKDLWNLIPDEKAIANHTLEELGVSILASDGTLIQKNLEAIWSRLGTAYPYLAQTAFRSYGVLYTGYVLTRFLKTLRKQAQSYIDLTQSALKKVFTPKIKDKTDLTSTASDVD